MSERRFDHDTYVYFANHVKAEVDRLLAQAAEQITRREQAQGKPAEAGIEHAAGQHLDEIRRQLERAQLSLVHHSDRRYAAAQALLRATDGGRHRTPLPAAETPARAAAA